MKALDVVENHFETRGVGVRLVQDAARYKHYKELGDISFCQAIKLARTGPVRIRKEHLSCPGARFVFGVEGAGSAPMVKALIQNRRMDVLSAKRAVQKVSRLKRPFRWIILDHQPAALAVFFFTPKKTMHLLTLLQAADETLAADLSCVMAMCGEVAARSLVSGRMTVSFGCPDSRKYGGLTDNELIIGIPQNKIRPLSKIIKSSGH